MVTQTSNIDDILSGSTIPSPSIPPTSEEKGNIAVPENTNEPTPYEHDDNFYLTPKEKANQESEENLESNEEVKTESKEKENDERDDYGNTKAAPKTYTEEEVNERINKAVRERLARRPNQEEQPPHHQVAQQAQGFEYNPDSEEPWEAQLEKFVERTVSKLGQRQIQQQQRVRDEQIQAEFEDKFNRGMNRFSDFRDVVANQPITDPMTYALRGLNDPAAFIYAASKRHPQELSRISQIADPAAQIMEMGRLEERMRKSQNGTSAPRPVSRSRDDGGMPTQAKKTEPSIEDLIARSDAKRRALLESKRRR